MVRMVEIITPAMASKYTHSQDAQRNRDERYVGKDDFNTGSQYQDFHHNDQVGHNAGQSYSREQAHQDYGFDEQNKKYRSRAEASESTPRQSAFVTDRRAAQLYMMQQIAQDTALIQPQNSVLQTDQAQQAQASYNHMAAYSLNDNGARPLKLAL